MPIYLFPLLSFACAFVVLTALLRWQHKLPLDEPNSRSLHSTPIPRIGGLGVTPVILLLACFFLAGGNTLPAILGTAILLAASLLDDYYGLPALPRLLLHLAVAFTLAWLAGLSLPITFAVALAIGWMTNLYNFMDGSNGLAGGMAVIGFSGYAAGAWLAGDPGLTAFSLLIVGAALAFLCFNFGAARMFLGDAGSIPLGFLVGALGFEGVVRELWPAWFPLVMFSAFIVDATLTLLRRLLRGERVWEAHREHAYQRLIRSGWSHTKVALHAYALMGLSVALGLLMSFGPDGLKWPGFAVLALTLVLAFGWTERRAPR